MRLIDAEATLQDVQEQIALIKTLFPDEEINNISKMLGITIKNQIDKMPTVEAIPTEWIKKYGVVKNEIVHTALENVLYWLIKDWEKENADFCNK